MIEGSSSTSQLSIETSYRGITSNNSQTFLEKSAMKELRTHLNFTQMRFYCRKQQGRTFHVTTVANSTGKAVVQYFSGQRDVQPDACGSFVRMEDDNSKLARVCNEWGYNGTKHFIGKWGRARDQDRLFHYAAFSQGSFHWMLDRKNSTGLAWMCDDSSTSPLAVSPGDFWKVFVR